MSWSSQKRSAYVGGMLAVIILILGWMAFVFLYEPPNCADGRHNGDEAGVDCGGSCERLCRFQAVDPIVLWSRFFELSPGKYNALALIENPNTSLEADSTPYTFTFRDSENALIAEVKGTVDIPLDRTFTVFEAGIDVGDREIVRSLFEFDDIPLWSRVTDEQVSVRVSDTELTRISSLPRLDAVVHNDNLFPVEDVEIVAVISDFGGNAIAISRTVIDFMGKGGNKDIVFTWPNPFKTEFVACTIPVDVVLLLDVSGSMNDKGDEPPQPITDAKNAALAFVENFKGQDSVGIVSFATLSEILQPIKPVVADTRNAISGINIRPDEESGTTNIGEAFLSAKESFEALSYDSKQSVVVMLTDGLANAPEDTGEEFAQEKASELKSLGVKIYTIGLGEEVNKVFLEEVATTPEQYYSAATGDELGTIYSEISEDICERSSVVKTDIYTSVGKWR